MITGWYLKDGQACAKGSTAEAQTTEPGEEMGQDARLEEGMPAMGNSKKGGKGILGRGDGERSMVSYAPMGLGGK